MNRRNLGALAWLWLSLAIIIADQLTKWWVVSKLVPGERVAVIPDVFYWTLAFNNGAAFSFLANSGGWQRWAFIALAVIISIILIVWLRRTRRGEWQTALPLALIIGGAIGNLIGRVRLGHVVDFVLVYLGDWAYPAFNVADSAITVGAILLIVLSFRRSGSEREARK